MSFTPESGWFLQGPDFEGWKYDRAISEAGFNPERWKNSSIFSIAQGDRYAPGT
jgi:hypothetical protein